MSAAAIVRVDALTLSIPGAPRTKKNHSQIVRAGGKTRLIPSQPYREWCQRVCLHLRHTPTLADRPYNVAATFYRDRRAGDAVGYYQALADALEAAGVVSDDKWFVSWDGSRLAHDPHTPRVELTITPTEPTDA